HSGLRCLLRCLDSAILFAQQWKLDLDEFDSFFVLGNGPFQCVYCTAELECFATMEQQCVLSGELSAAIVRRIREHCVNESFDSRSEHRIFRDSTCLQ